MAENPAAATAASAALNVPRSEVTVSGSTLEVRSSQLATALIQENVSALAWLREAAPSLTAADISVEPNGSVRILNPELAEKLQSRLGPGVAADNGICGFKCGSALLTEGVTNIRPTAG